MSMMTSAAQMDMAAAIKAQLASRHAAIASSMDEASQMEARNDMLIRQVQVMQQMMSASGMSMQTFMKTFPMPPDELEREKVISKLGILDLPRPIVALDALLAKFCNSSRFGGRLSGIWAAVISGDVQRLLSCCFFHDDKWKSSVDLGFEHMPDMPRKGSA